MVFKGTMEVYEGIYRFNSKRVRKKEKYANSKWILRNLFCCCSNLSNDDIISERPGLRIGMDFRGAPGLKTGMKNDIFWSKIGSAFEEPGGTPPPRIPEIPPPSPQGQSPREGRITKAEHFNISIHVKLEILCYLNRIIHFQ